MPADGIDITKFLPLLARPILEELVRDLLNTQSTSDATSSLIQSRLSDAMHSYDASCRRKISTLTHHLDWRATTDDYAEALAPLLQDVTHLRTFPCPQANKIALDLLLNLADETLCDMDGHAKACGYGERASFDRVADQAFIEIVQDRRRDEGEEFLNQAKAILDELKSMADHLERYGIETWFPRSKDILEGWLEASSDSEEEGDEESVSETGKTELRVPRPAHLNVLIGLGNCGCTCWKVCLMVTDLGAGPSLVTYTTRDASVALARGVAMSSDDNPRPHKRQRTDPSSSVSNSLSPLPPPILLVSLPGLLIHPPTHRFHAQSLIFSLITLRKCLSLANLSPDIECRTWAALAEVGMNVIDGGFVQKPEHKWAVGIEQEVERATSKGHPSLRIYKHHLTLIHARISHLHQNHKFSRAVIRRLLASFTPSDPPAIIYSTHLTVISHLSSTVNASLEQQYIDTHAALNAAQIMQTLAISNGHPHVALLTHVLRLGLLVSRRLWSLVRPAIEATETALGLSYDTSSSAGKFTSTSPSKAPRVQAPPPTSFISFDDPFETIMAIHTLILSVTFLAHAGHASDVSPRLSHLHALLDAGALDHFPDGIVQIVLPSGPPLALHTTHPRILFFLGFLVSAVAKRDAIGRKPRRKVFAMEGLAMFNKGSAPGLQLPPFASLGELEEVDESLALIKADLLCELISVAIMRNEFNIAEENLDVLIAHTRTHNIFSLYADRVTLHHAHLAHALGQSERALQCYRVAADLAGEGEFVRVSARAGIILLRIGIRGGQFRLDDGDEEDEQLIELGRQAIKECKGMGGDARGIKGTPETGASPGDESAGQPHARAGAGADLIALAAGLGAPATKASGDRVGTKEEVVAGNAPLRLWVGERVVELYKRAGKEDRAQKQALLNAELSTAVERIAERGTRISAGGCVCGRRISTRRRRRTAKEGPRPPGDQPSRRTSSIISHANSTASAAASTRHMLSNMNNNASLEPPNAPFASSNSVRSHSPRTDSPLLSVASSNSLSVNYLPSKFSDALLYNGLKRRNGKGSPLPMPKRGGGREAFRSGEARMPGDGDDDYDGVQSGWFGKDGGARPRLHWNRFKWTLFVANILFSAYSLAGLIFLLLTWFDVWKHADVVRVGNRPELVLSTLAASFGIVTSLVGWAGILLNNRSFLAVYTFFLWICFAFLVIPGYLTYKKRNYNLDGKINAQWSQVLGLEGWLRIQNQLHCCGYFSPFVEAAISQTCYSRSVLPGCKGPYTNFEKTVLERWYTVVFSIVPFQIFVIVCGLLCSNHITYRFGKGMMPKAYRLDMNTMAIIMDQYANQLAEQYGADVASEVMARSRSNLHLDAMPTMPYASGIQPSPPGGRYDSLQNKGSETS
ncbi:hypothetical protein EW146_g1131 [Bondarzewia mesenterica]|uniref:Tetraspanin Tsp2 family n=1 Tax=Bondarzewia mesenterica TaxID=1095465 RepID=A0A4S4M4V6_9AGAM|nr:hypothetical protein EW146_g1131 [Bondarzewia mesenterica]